jgi:hypothetical protein
LGANASETATEPEPAVVTPARRSRKADQSVVKSAAQDILSNLENIDIPQPDTDSQVQFKDGPPFADDLSF